jgi:hypothetical protein
LSVIVDSSFLFSLTYTYDKHHARCLDVIGDLTEKIVIPVTVLPEVTYLIKSRLGQRMMRRFVRELAESDWHIENLDGEDLDRTQELLGIYHDSELDFADATIVAMAERLDVRTILTLDRRDFLMVRPLHVDYFDLRP